MDYRELEDEFFDVNNLTVVASESYETLAKSLQSEILSSLSRKSYDIIDDSLFVNKELKNKNGESIVIDKIVYNEIFLDFAFNGYVDRQGKIQQKLREDISDNNLSIPKSLVPFEEDYTKLVEGLFTESTYDIKNANKDNIKGLKLNNDNFSKFQELWKNIKTKSTYKVAFNSNELIENAVNSLNNNLIISKLRIKITEGEQKSAMSSSSLESSDAMYIKKVQYKVYNNVATSNTKYDLIGNLATDTGLTRHTIISILKDIRKDVFDQYKYNPEEFIRQACRLINREKSKIVVKNITYVKTDKEYDDEIFTNNTLNGKLGINAMKTQKHIYDYIITDSKIEMEFAKGLEEGSEAYVYAKLPNKFKIRTPFGNYTPDWAISLNTKDMKNVCLIIETKGSMNDSQLKGVEYGKIECAKKHFEEISNGSIKYKVIDSYEHLIDYITGVTSEDIL